VGSVKGDDLGRKTINHQSVACVWMKEVAKPRLEDEDKRHVDNDAHSVK